ncbi:MAG: DUF1761 domain-containing protein [Proteobacteria bacterium]|nr:DUF1761 domain-containing protein [Pseudomonadota bacterium]
MAFAGINYVAVLGAAILSFAFAWVWYGALGGLWLTALGTSETEIRAKGMTIGPLVVTFVALLVMATVLAGVIGHLGPDAVTVRNGVITGALCWLGFVITALAANHAFQRRRFALTAIDGGHWLGVLLLQGVVIGIAGV